MNLKPEIFRQYDIRGIVGEDLTPETVEILGKGIGTHYRRKGSQKVALGRDCRLSSPSFSKILTDALNSTGCEVIDLGKKLKKRWKRPGLRQRRPWKRSTGKKLKKRWKKSKLTSTQ